MHVALYQPEIAQNVGTILRLCACFGISVDIIGPTGFPWNTTKMRRAGMDYISKVKINHHLSFENFEKATTGKRVILLDVKGEVAHWDFHFSNDDILLFGRESSGVPDDIFFKSHFKLKIPIMKETRSLNLAMSVAICTSEALRQLR